MINNMDRKIWFVRHAQSEYNKKKLFSPKKAVHNAPDAFKAKVNRRSTNQNTCNHQRDVKRFIGVGKPSM